MSMVGVLERSPGQYSCFRAFTVNTYKEVELQTGFAVCKHNEVFALSTTPYPKDRFKPLKMNRVYTFLASPQTIMRNRSPFSVSLFLSGGSHDPSRFR